MPKEGLDLDVAERLCGGFNLRGHLFIRGIKRKRRGGEGEESFP